jgi:hypothetical protein
MIRCGAASFCRSEDLWRALAGGKVAGLQVDLLVVIALERGIHRRGERIDEVHIGLGWHFYAEQVE